MEREVNYEVESFRSSKTITEEVLRNIQDIMSEKCLSGIETGFIKLDQITQGWQPSDLIIIAGRTGMGKSAFMLSMIRNISVDFGNPIALFSPEMTSEQLLYRLISIESGLSLEKLRSGKLEPHEWELLSVKSKIIEKAPIYIDDTHSISIDHLYNKSKILVEEHGVKAIFIDNIHLMSAGNKQNGDITREHEISIIARRLKAIAKELKISFIAISQLSKEGEVRGGGINRRPFLSDLRGSGTLEEIADIVLFLYRPEYYFIEEWDDDDALPTANQAELIVAKHRNGSVDNIRLEFIKNRGKFDNLHDFTESLGDLPTKMNHEDNPFINKNLPSPNEAFGSNLNDDDDDSDVPF